MEGHTDKVFGVAMAGDGGTVVSCSWDMSVRVWDVESGQSIGAPLQPLSLLDGVSPGFSSSSVINGVSRGTGGFLDLGSLNANAEEGVFKYSTKDRMKDFFQNQVKKEKKEQAQRKGFAVEPVEASTSKSILPEFGSYSSRQVLADMMGGKSFSDAFKSNPQPSSCTQSGMLQGHEKEVLGVALSQDGLRCASCSVDGTVRMWDLTTGTQVARCDGHTDWVWGVSMTADGHLVASCGKDHSARIWTFEGELMQVVQHKGEVLSVALSSDRKLLVTGQGKSVFVWQVHNGAKIVELRQHEDLVRGVSVTDTGHRIASGSKDCTVVVWDTVNGSALFILKGHTCVVRAVHITGAAVLSCSSDKTVRLWNIATGTCVATLYGHTEDVRDICMNADNSMAVSCSFDQTVRVWDLRAGKEVAVLKGHSDKIFGVAVNGLGSVAVSCSWDMSIRIWDIDQGQEHGELNPPSVLDSFLSPESLPVKLAPPATPTRVQAHDTREIPAHEKEILGVAITADGSEAVTCSVDGTVRLWELDTGEQLVKWEGHSDWAWGVAITPDGARAASCGRDRTVIVWDMMLRRVLKQLVHASEVVCVALFDDGATVVSGQGKDVLIWNVSLSKQTASLKGHTQPVRCIAVSNGRVVSGSQDTTLRVWSWDGDAWSCKHVLHGHNQTVRGVSVQNNVILSGSQDQSLRAWHLEKGQLISTMYGHTGDVRSVGLSSNGRRAASGAFDRTVRIWDVASGTELSELQGHTDKIFGVAICADASRAVSCSWDASLRVWDLSDNPTDHQVLQPPSATAGVDKRPAPDSILGGQSIVGAVKAALNRSSGYDEIQTDSDSAAYDEIQTDSDSNGSGRKTPDGPSSGGGVGSLPDGHGRRARIRVELDEEEGALVEPEEASTGVGRLGEAIQRFLGRTDDVDLDDDEKEWERSVLAERRHRDIDPENAHEMSRLTGDDVDFAENEDEEKIQMQKDKARHRSSIALALGFVCFFPWCAGLILDGGLRSKDKITRTINRIAVCLMSFAIFAAVSIVVVRYNVKDNVFCSVAAQCDKSCAVVCSACTQCIGYGHWWCHQPRGENKLGFCSSKDGSRDDFVQTKLSATPIRLPAIACSQGCGCNDCLGANGNWCRYPIGTTRTTQAAHNPTRPSNPARNMRESSSGLFLSLRSFFQARFSFAISDGGVGLHATPTPTARNPAQGLHHTQRHDGIARQALLRRESEDTVEASRAEPHWIRTASDEGEVEGRGEGGSGGGQRALWSFDGDDGYCDMRLPGQVEGNRFASENPELCDCQYQRSVTSVGSNIGNSGAGTVGVGSSVPAAEAEQCQRSCCCDLEGCHPSKCST